MPIIDPDSIDESLACPPCENDFPICYKVIVEVERGNGLPGSCCPRYECLDEEPVCDGSKRRFYKNKCTVCDPCEPLAIQCKEICPMEEPEPICLSDNNEYHRNGDIWMENNGCTTCMCEGGYVTRNAVQCNHYYRCNNPVEVKGQCCPVCPDELGVSNSIYDDGNHKYRNTTSAPILGESESSSSGGAPLCQQILLIPFQTPAVHPIAHLHHLNWPHRLRTQVNYPVPQRGQVRIRVMNNLENLPLPSRRISEPTQKNKKPQVLILQWRLPQIQPHSKQQQLPQFQALQWNFPLQQMMVSPKWILILMAEHRKQLMSPPWS